MKIKQYILLACAISLMMHVGRAQVPFNDQKDANDRKDSLLRVELKQATYKLYTALVQQKSAYRIYADAGNGAYNLGTPLEIQQTDSGYRFVCAGNTNAIIHFSYLTDLKIKIYNSNNSIQASSNGVSHLKLGEILLTVNSEQQFILNNLRQQFIHVQRLYNDAQFDIYRFETEVSSYHLLNEKPIPSEQQRKLILQADAATKLYQYEKSIALNNAIIRLHPTAYPDVYLNIAVLQAETNRLHSAIYNMKKYLLFNPGSTDADFAKRKINEWEIILTN